MEPAQMLQNVNEDARFFVLIIASAILVALVFILTVFILNRHLKHRKEIRLEGIQSGNIDPMLTNTSGFDYFRRGIILIFVGINFALILAFEHPGPLLFLPLTIGLAYLTIFFINKTGMLDLFPGNGKKESESKE